MEELSSRRVVKRHLHLLALAIAAMLCGCANHVKDSQAAASDAQLDALRAQIVELKIQLESEARGREKAIGGLQTELAAVSARWSALASRLDDMRDNLRLSDSAGHQRDERTWALINELRHLVEISRPVSNPEGMQAEGGRLVSAVSDGFSATSAAISSLRKQGLPDSSPDPSEDETDLLPLLVSLLGPAASFLVGVYFGPLMTQRLERRKYTLTLWEQFVKSMPEIQAAQALLDQPETLDSAGLTKIQAIRSWMTAVAAFAMQDKVVDRQLMLDLGLQEPMRFFLDKLESAARTARSFPAAQPDSTPQQKSDAVWAADELDAEARVAAPVRSFINAKS